MDTNYIAYLTDQESSKKITVKSPLFTIGRANENDFATNDQQSSSRHALIQSHNGHYHITDLKSSNGTKVNGKSISQKTSLFNEDIIQIGQRKFVFSKVSKDIKLSSPFSFVLISINGDQPGVETEIHDSQLLIGRLPVNDLCIDYQKVSSRHAQITIKESQAFLSDLSSANGTIVNGHSLKHEYKLSSGDFILIGDQKFLFYKDPITKKIPFPTVFTLEDLNSEELDNTIKVQGSNFLIGRSKNNHLSIDDDNISFRQALIRIKNSKAYLTDLKSVNGTSINGRKVQSEQVLHDGDIIKISTKKYAFSEKSFNKKAPVIDKHFFTLTAQNSHNFNDKTFIKKNEFFIGRSTVNDLDLEDSKVSTRHAKIQIKGNIAHLYDLSSANGTTLNGKKVTHEQFLKDGDIITFGDSLYVFNTSSNQTEDTITTKVPRQVPSSE